MSMHVEWLSLIEISGAFLAEPILDQAFPQGLEGLETSKKQAFRQTYEEWREALDTGDELQAKLHQEWINWVLKTGLEWDEDDEGEELKAGANVPADLKLELLEHSLTLKPDYALFGSDANKPYLLVASYPAHIELTEVVAGDGWSTTPAERMSHLCRATGTRLGLVTNGEQWMIVDAPEGGITSYASWYARLWSQEPVTLKAFFSLLNIRTVFSGFGLDAKNLTELLDDSLKHQDEVTETLGAQVQRAVEVLIQSIDRINNDANGELLKGVEPAELYEAGLTYMMRLVFLLCAEERGLLLLGDETYEANYAVSTLRMKLREEAGLHGEEVLSYRNNAWARLLAVFRAVYGGVEHEGMRMPALGGSLFDPDRFPFLEGRAKNSNWKIDEARPLPIDNRTVLLFLDAIQLYQGRALSYRALDVEQIGYVYEGLLERTVIRSPDVTLELNSTKSAKKPWLLLGELASAELDGAEAVKKLLEDRTGSSASRITNDLAKEVSEGESEKLLLACQNDTELRDRIRPYYHFLRTDAWGNPLLYPKDAFMVATGADRRETGAHYTPKSLTESIVRETLEPVVYIGPTEGKDKQDWQLKTPTEILDLKICDLAMGSGAFLVQVCRYLSERLLGAWEQAESHGNRIAVDGVVVETLTDKEPLTTDTEERLIIARRLISERCIYGVDVNPLAVELAKLSIWLVTLAKGRPFGYLDHNLKSGDSLLGVSDSRQCINLDYEGYRNGERKLFAADIEESICIANDLRSEINGRRILDIHDVDVAKDLNNKALAELVLVNLIADNLTADYFSSGDNRERLGSKTNHLSIQIGDLSGPNRLQTLALGANDKLKLDPPNGRKQHTPFHWAIAFPEVFERPNPGFDAFVGNPPFLWALRISIRISVTYGHFLKRFWSHAQKNADLCTFFLLRAYSMLRSGGTMGFLTTNSISEADNRQTSLDYLAKEGASIFNANADIVWPGPANVRVAKIIISKSQWEGLFVLNNNLSTSISTSLTTSTTELSAAKLNENMGKCFKGSVPLGDGFFVSDEEYEDLISTANNRAVLYSYLNGKELNSSPLQVPGRKVIYFRNWELDECRKYPECLKILEKRVKPVRDKIVAKNNMAKQRKELWWKFTGPTVELYKAIADLKQVIVASAVSKHHAMIMAPSSYIYSNALNVFAFEDWSNFALLQSNIHSTWALTNGSKLKADPRYNVSDCFETFPRPKAFLNEVEVAGEEYHKCRQQIMLGEDIGLTDLYNLYHDKSFETEAITRLRELAVNMDKLIVESYGYESDNIHHDFIDRGLGARFSLNFESESYVLSFLSDLNSERASDQGAARKKKITKKKKVVKLESVDQFDMFGS